ncbi:MAG: hypothetical protein ABI051_14340 [Vicinamibacterales bacterium]
MRWLLAVSLSALAFAFSATGTFVPLQTAPGVDYLFVWSGSGVMLMMAVLIAASFGGTYALVVRRAARRGPAVLAKVRTGRWMLPMAWLGLLTLGILPAVPGIGEPAAVVSYFLYDLRWWWVAIVVAWTGWRAHVVLGKPLESVFGFPESLSRPTRLLVLDALLFLVVVGWAIGVSPRLRFTDETFGDEPRYLRYCEAWYQGAGIDVSHNALLSDSALDAPSHVLRNASLFGSAVWDDALSLRSDIRLFLDNPGHFRWNRIPLGRNGFVTGKHRSGVYQLHQPGLSLLLFPGYYLDRHLLSLDAGYQGEFPANLTMTSTSMLFMLGASAVGLFRLLRNGLHSEGVAWLGAAFATVTFPLSAFAFQLYPEVPAFLVIVLVLNFAWFHSAGRTGIDPAKADRLRDLARSTAAGLGCGLLAWLHPRFFLVSALLAAICVARGDRRQRRCVSCAFGLTLFLLLGYNFHITGSWMPNAMYAAAGDTHQIIPGVIVDNLIAYGVHGAWGLLGYAPWLFATAPGLLVLARTHRDLALLIAGLGLSLAIPAAGHALNPAGGTPGRFVVAIVPLMIWPVMVLARRFWCSPAFRVAAVIAMVVSLDMSLSYNWTHVKSFGPMVDHSRSGWKPLLALPAIREYFGDMSQDGYVVFVLLSGALAGASWLAWRRSGARVAHVESGPASLRLTRAVVVVTAAVVVSSSAATRAVGRWTRPDYLLVDAQARREAAVALTALDRCRVCFSSSRQHVSWIWLEPNPARQSRLDVRQDGRTMSLRVTVESAEGVDGFGQVHVDFGDGATARTPVVGWADLSHAYRDAGAYEVVVSVQLRDRTITETRSTRVGGNQ